MYIYIYIYIYIFISNCGTPTQKESEFLDNHLKPIM